MECFLVFIHEFVNIYMFVSALAATKPVDQTAKKMGVQHGFKTAPDGRFIIKTDDDENGQKRGQYTVHFR